jgi:hypothetical protein
MAGTLNSIPDRIRINGIGFEFPDTVPRLDDRGYNIHDAWLARALIKNIGAG